MKEPIITTIADILREMKTDFIQFEVTTIKFKPETYKKLEKELEEHSQTEVGKVITLFGIPIRSDETIEKDTLVIIYKKPI